MPPRRQYLQRGLAGSGRESHPGRGQRHRSGQERVGKRAREGGNWGCRTLSTRRIPVPSAPELYPLIEAWIQALPASTALHATALSALAHLVTALLVGQSLRPTALMRAFSSPLPVPARQRYKRVARAWTRPWLSPAWLVPRQVRWGWTVRLRATHSVSVAGQVQPVRTLLAAASPDRWTAQPAHYGHGPQALPGTLVIGQGLAVLPWHQRGPASVHQRLAQYGRRQAHLARKHPRQHTDGARQTDPWVVLFTSHSTWLAAVRSYDRRWATEVTQLHCPHRSPEPLGCVAPAASLGVSFPCCLRTRATEPVNRCLKTEVTLRHSSQPAGQPLR